MQRGEKEEGEIGVLGKPYRTWSATQFRVWANTFRASHGSPTCQHRNRHSTARMLSAQSVCKPPGPIKPESQPPELGPIDRRWRAGKIDRRHGASTTSRGQLESEPREIRDVAQNTLRKWAAEENVPAASQAGQRLPAFQVAGPGVFWGRPCRR